MSPLRLHIVSSLDAKLLQLGVECGSFEAKAGGCTVVAADEAFGLTEHTEDVLPLGSLQGWAFRLGAVLRLFGFQFRQGNMQDRAPGEDDRALEKVLQLADVAGPGPALQGFHRLYGDRLDDFAHAAAVVADKVPHQ